MWSFRTVYSNIVLLLLPVLWWDHSLTFSPRDDRQYLLPECLDSWTIFTCQLLRPASLFEKIKKIRKTQPKKNQKEVNARPPLDNTTPIRSAATPSSKVLLDWRNVRKNVSCRHHLKSWLYLRPRLFWVYGFFSFAIFIWILILIRPTKFHFRALVVWPFFWGGCVCFATEKNSPDVSSDLVAMRGDWPWWGVGEKANCRDIVQMNGERSTFVWLNDDDSDLCSGIRRRNKNKQMSEKNFSLFLFLFSFFSGSSCSRFENQSVNQRDFGVLNWLPQLPGNGSLFELNSGFWKEGYSVPTEKKQLSRFVYLLHERPTVDGWMKAEGGKKRGMSYSAHARPSCPAGSSHSRAPVWASSFFFIFRSYSFFSSISLSFFLGVSLFFYLPRRSNGRVHREDAGHLLWRKEYENRTRKIVFFLSRENRKWRFRLLFSIFRGWKWNSLARTVSYSRFFWIGARRKWEIP